MTTAGVTSRRIRMAELSDREAVVTMALRFLRETPYGAMLTENADQLRAFTERLLTNPDGAVIVAEKDGALIGMIALWAFAHPYSGALIASELVWWVNPEERGSVGVRLLKRAEQWTKDSGATALQMIAPNARVEAFYQACGYERVEVSYQRRF